MFNSEVCEEYLLVATLGFEILMLKWQAENAV